MTTAGVIIRHRSTLKFLFVGALSLAMLIPLTMVRSVVAERQGMQDTAARVIASRWGGPQTVGGLVALREAEAMSAGPRTVRRQMEWRARTLSELAIEARLTVEERYLGIYRVPVYTGTLTIRGRLGVESFDPERVPSGLTLWLPLSDVRGLREISTLRIGPLEIPARPLAARPAQLSGLQFAIPVADRQALAGQDFVDYQLELTLAGSGSLCFLPLAETSSISLVSDWPHPEFVGQFLPIERKIGTDSVQASWRLLGLNRPFGDEWALDDLPFEKLAATGFGMRLDTPVDVYQRSERSVKYGSLFIALTFVTLFLFEVTGGKPLHPVPYMLTGAALAVFYLVLLALSEHLPFAAAFGLAASLLAGIVGPYTGALLGARSGLLAALMLFVTYTLLYLLVSAQHLSLLLGSLSLLLAIAALMFLTREVDWYGYGSS
jgi:inner membrane protein